MRILLIEDELRMAQALCEILKLEKYEVDHCADGLSGLAAIESAIYDIIILDVMLPGMDGFKVARSARSKGIRTPMPKSKIPLAVELYSKINALGLRPKTIVEYTREPFVYSAGNVRVTIDRDIRTGMSCTDFLNPSCVTVPVENSPIILEVKWDNFLPDIIRDAVLLEDSRVGAFSKYAACRCYG